jgi:tRNA 2-selenouridine synthase
MPDFFYNNLQKAPVIILIMDVDKRVPRLIEEYSTYSPEMLKNSIMKISKRMGGDNTKDAIDAVDTGDFEKAIRITLKYYDKAYLYGITKKHSGSVIYIEAENDDIEANANKILEASKQITWESD